MNNFFIEAYENLSESDREEFYKSVFMNMRGENAYKIRADYYKTQFRSMGENVQIGVGVKIINPQYISIGDNVSICDGVTLIARGEKGITIGNGVTLKDRVYLDTENSDVGYILIADKVYIGTGTTLFGHMGLEIGEYSLLAQNITITPCSLTVPI